MSKYPISFWSTVNMKNAVPDTPDMWRGLGITLAMSPSYAAEDKQEVIKLLDRSAELGIRVIMRDYRTHWRQLTKLGEEGYETLFKKFSPITAVIRRFSAFLSATSRTLPKPRTHSPR